MHKIRFAVAGTGWRSEFYVRIARWLPARFELTGVLCRTQARAQQYAQQHGVKTVWTLEGLLETKPMFVVVCVNKAGLAQMSMDLLRRGMPVLSETPYAVDEETLRALYAVQRETGTLLDLAEQYFLYPTHQARIAAVQRGMLGAVSSCWLSAMHDYHGVSILRAYLMEDAEPTRVLANKTRVPIVKTGDRSGYLTDGEMGEETRLFARLHFADGKLGLYDFAGTQYHSAIRSSHLRVLGARGELFDDTLRFLDAQSRPVCERLVIHRDLASGTIRSIDLAGERLYTNPFGADVPMNEDELAIAEMLVRMGDAVRGGARHYPLMRGMEDSRLAVLMHRIGDAGGEADVAPTRALLGQM